MPSQCSDSNIKNLYESNNTKQHIKHLIHPINSKFENRHEISHTYLRLLGGIRAGFASPGEEELNDLISLDHYLLRDKDSSYLLQVQGDSMIDAGILDGDMIIFERTTDCNVGDIVVALTEDGYTLKYLRKKDGHMYLEPANDSYPLIYPKEGEIIGVVTSSFRTYKK